MQQIDKNIIPDDEGGSESSDYDEIKEFLFTVNFEAQGIKQGAKYVFVATLGIQSLWLAQVMKQNGGKRIGHINYSKATQSSLASIYESVDCVALIFNKEIKDYHYNDYNFGQFLVKLIPEAAQVYIGLNQKIKFIILSDIHVNLLSRKIEVEELELRQISNLETNTLGIPYIEIPNEFQGLVADVYTQLQIHGRDVVAIFMVLQSYEAKYCHLEKMTPLSKHFGWDKASISKEDIVDEIRRLNQSKFKDIIYL